MLYSFCKAILWMKLAIRGGEFFKSPHDFDGRGFAQKSTRWRRGSKISKNQFSWFMNDPKCDEAPMHFDPIVLTGLMLSLIEWPNRGLLTHEHLQRATCSSLVKPYSLKCALTKLGKNWKVRGDYNSNSCSFYNF